MSEEENQHNQTNILLCDAAYEMAITNIPEMLNPSKMIILNGYINKKPLRILFDTGASISVIFAHIVERLDLLELVDKRYESQLAGIGKEQSMCSGKLWYIELELNNCIYPISLTVSNNKIDQFDMILGMNFLQLYNVQFDYQNKRIKLNDRNYINSSC